MRFILALAAASILASPAASQQIAPAMVYFDAGSDALDAADRAQLARAADQIRQIGGSFSISLAGHADDPEGSADEAIGLSQRRANTVRDHLVSLGVPASLMTTQAFGETRPAIESTEAQWENRRVEITFGPGSGW